MVLLLVHRPCCNKYLGDRVCPAFSLRFSPDNIETGNCKEGTLSGSVFAFVLKPRSPYLYTGLKGSRRGQRRPTWRHLVQRRSCSWKARAFRRTARTSCASIAARS